MTDQTILAAGQPAPDFTLPSSPDSSVTLSDLRGKPVVLIFYPADWSPVCGDELAIFSQAMPLISAKGAQVFGISVDSVWSHKAFRDARHLGFDLLSDANPKGKVAQSYGAYDAEAGLCERALFVIDPQGTISWSYLSPMSVNPGANGVLDALDQLDSSGGAQ